MSTLPDGGRITSIEEEKTRNYFFPTSELNLQNMWFISKEKKNKIRTSGNLFSPACLPLMPVLFTDMMDAGKESVGRYQAKKTQCQNTVLDD